MASGKQLIMVFGRRLRSLREASGLTQEQLGSSAGFDYKHIGTLERGEKTPSFDAVEKLAAALNVQFYELFLPDELAAMPSTDDRELAVMTKDIERHGTAELKRFLAQTLAAARMLIRGN